MEIMWGLKYANKRLVKMTEQKRSFRSPMCNVMPIQVAVRSKAWFCGRYPVEIVGSNPTGNMDVCLFECCVLSGRGLCDELITRPEESYRLWCVVVCDLETSRMRRPWPTGGCRAKKRKDV